MQHSNTYVTCSWFVILANHSLLALIMLRWPSPHMLTGHLLIVMAAVSMVLSLPVKETWWNLPGWLLLSTAPVTHNSVFYTDDINHCVFGSLLSFSRNLVSCDVSSESLGWCIDKIFRCCFIFLTDFAWSLWCQNARFWRRIPLLDLETLHCIIPVSLANCSWQVCLQWKSVSEAGRLLFFLTLSGTAERDRPTASFFSCPNLLPPQISRCLCQGENDLKRWHSFSCCCDGVQWTECAELFFLAVSLCPSWNWK